MDRLKGPDLQRQAKTFSAHIDLAEQYRQPLIIHCVRAFDELIIIEKQHKIKVPAIMRSESKTAKALEEVWMRRLPFFLETDGSGLDIREIYGAASNLLKISTDTLKDPIFATWEKNNLKNG